jgi:hypothetical protein
MVARKVGPPKQRRTLVQVQAAKRSPLAFNKPGKFHAHRCIDCNLRYEDACHEPRVNATCGCKTRLHNRPVWLRDKDPQECCRLYSVEVTDPVILERYALGGDTPWFMCQTCFRSHPVDPRE